MCICRAVNTVNCRGVTFKPSIAAASVGLRAVAIEAREIADWSVALRSRPSVRMNHDYCYLNLANPALHVQILGDVQLPSLHAGEQTGMVHKAPVHLVNIEISQPQNQCTHPGWHVHTSGALQLPWSHWGEQIGVEQTESVHL